MPSRSINDLHPELVEVWEYAEQEFKRLYPDEPQPILTCTYRSNEEQSELYAIGRTKPGRKVTYAKPGKSKHNRYKSEAFDVAFVTLTKKLDWRPVLFDKLAKIIKDKFENVVWGGDFVRFKDKPHFELKG